MITRYEELRQLAIKNTKEFNKAQVDISKIAETFIIKLKNYFGCEGVAYAIMVSEVDREGNEQYWHEDLPVRVCYFSDGNWYFSLKFGFRDDALNHVGTTRVLIGLKEFEDGGYNIFVSHNDEDEKTPTLIEDDADLELFFETIRRDIKRIFNRRFKL